MKKLLAGIGAILLGLIGLVALLALGFGLEILGIKKDSITKPMRENVRRDVFENTQSYNAGKIQDLARYKLEYERATEPDEKLAIASLIRSQFANFPVERLPVELSSFLTSIRGY